MEQEQVPGEVRPESRRPVIERRAGNGEPGAEVHRVPEQTVGPPHHQAPGGIERSGRPLPPEREGEDAPERQGAAEDSHHDTCDLRRSHGPAGPDTSRLQHRAGEKDQEESDEEGGPDQGPDQRERLSGLPTPSQVESAGRAPAPRGPARRTRAALRAPAACRSAARPDRGCAGGPPAAPGARRRAGCCGGRAGWWPRPRRSHHRYRGPRARGCRYWSPSSRHRLSTATPRVRFQEKEARSRNPIYSLGWAGLPRPRKECAVPRRLAILCLTLAAAPLAAQMEPPVEVASRVRIRTLDPSGRAVRWMDGTVASLTRDTLQVRADGRSTTIPYWAEPGKELWVRA